MTYLVNRRPCRATGAVTPHELLFGSPPDYGHLRVFGSLCYPNQAATAANKLCSRSMPVSFLGTQQITRDTGAMNGHQTRHRVTSRRL